MAGTVTGPASDKAARFLQLCDAFGLPVLSLVDTPGFMVGPERERRVRELTAQLFEQAGALNAARIFELDDVIDPADTRRLVARTLAAAGTPVPSGRTVDTW
jgi:acetyl-CoA carboxylase carboxyltransferase component